MNTHLVPRPTAATARVVEDLAFQGLRGLSLGTVVAVGVYVAQTLATMGPLGFACGVVCALDIAALGILFLKDE